MANPEESENRLTDERDRSATGFVAWRDQLPFFDLDGERFYLPTGDVPMDEDQIRQMWLRLPKV